MTLEHLCKNLLCSETIQLDHFTLFVQMRNYLQISVLILAVGSQAHGGVGDPQIATDHRFYPGELACSNFERLFSAQADQYRRVTGNVPQTDHEKAIAAWFWRNTHYWHGEEGAEDLWGAGFGKGGDTRTREYWTGLFAHGFGLCGTTHSQWTAELNALLGHNRARGLGVEGHNALEAFLRGGAYGEGRWALLDHDLSTIIFDTEGKRLLSVPEIKQDVQRLTDRAFSPGKQNGWLVCGLHPDDGTGYKAYNTAEYLPGYAGVPPIAHLRRGETLRRYLEPGLDDGKTFVFWGRNYNTAGIPGPERSITWVNQPEKMRGSITGAGYREGQARFANAVYTYTPNFMNADYREGVIEETTNSVTFEFYTPYIIGTTPPNNKEWGIYDDGGKNGLIVTGSSDVPIQISVDQGATWEDCGRLGNQLDLTDYVKGRRQYWIRFGAGAKTLADSALAIRTVCQSAIGILPRLKDGQNKITFQSTGRAVLSAGPNLPQAAAHIVNGKFNSPNVTLELVTPRLEPILEIYAAAHIASGNPPDTNIQYHIEYSADSGKTWNPIVKNWTIPRRGDEPADFWSQSLCYGAITLTNTTSSRVQIRFQNNGKRNYLRAEAHLVYKTPPDDPTRVTFNWSDTDATQRNSTHTFQAGGQAQIVAAQKVRTHWIEFQPSR
jgi:hypothetical protein